MSERKVLRYYHHICFQFTTTLPSSFTSTINVPFIPDELVVRQFSYQRSNATNGAYYLICDELTGQPGAALGLLKDRCCNISNATYPLGRTVAGLYTFLALTPAKTVGSLTNGRVSMNLEFRKYL